MRLALVLSLLLAVAVPATADAVWGPAPAFSARHAGVGQPAVNGRGDVALVWINRSPPGLRVTLLRAGGGHRTLALAKRPGSPAIVLDERGGATAAWTVGTRLYSAYGSLRGRWSAPQLIARNAFGPALAVSPQRRVLLAWMNLSGSTGVAWRAPGHAFSRPVKLRRPAPALRPGNSPVSDVGTSFDARGRAYLWGTCDGVVRVAGATSRRLSLVAVAPGAALGFSLSVVGDGGGVASWIDSRCSSDAAAGPEPGPLRVRVLRAGAFAAPVTLATATSSTQAFALAGTGSLISGWVFENQMLWALDAQGALQSATTLAPDRVPLAVDIAGDLLLTAPYAGVVVQRRDGAEERFPNGYAGVSAVAPNARRFAAVSDPDLTLGANPRPTSPRRRLSVSVWRP